VTYVLIGSLFSACTRTIRRKYSSILVKSLNGKPAVYTSYSTIVKNANSIGIWWYRGHVFSINRSLERTIIHLVSKSTAGYSANEVGQILRMEVSRPLNHLNSLGYVRSVKIGHCTFYLSPQYNEAQQQMKNRYEMNDGYHLKLNQWMKETVFSQAGEVLHERIESICHKKDIHLSERDLDITLCALIRPLIRAGNSDGDLSHYLQTSPELIGFYSFINQNVPSRSEINALKHRIDRFLLTEIFNEIVIWIIEQLKLKKVTVAIDGTHCYQSRGNKRGIKVHCACITELYIPIGFIIHEDGMEYDLKSLTPLLKQIKNLGLAVDFVIGDALYDVPEFYYEVNRILGAEGISCYGKNRLLAHTSPVIDNLLQYFGKKNQTRQKVIDHNEGRLRGRPKKVPESKVNFNDKENIGECLRLYPLTQWGSEERKEVYKRRTDIERLFSILKLWLGLDGMRTKEHARMWNVFSCFISLLTVCVLTITMGIPQLLVNVRKLVI
jgi:hypothetical protein